MNRYESLRNKFDTQALVCGITCSMILDPILISKMDHPQLDFMLFDAEHGRYDAQNLLPLLHETRMMGLPTIVRISDAYYHLAAKALDMGADGIMLPRTETVEQLKRAVDGLCFHPVGRKGVGGIGQMRPGEEFASFSRTRFLLPQIESPKGIENLPEMLRTFGAQISAVMIGPYDMSVMVGTPLDIFSDAVLESVRKIFEISHAFGKSCGIFCDDLAAARRFRALGANVIWTGMDTAIISKAVTQTVEDVLTLR